MVDSRFAGWMAVDGVRLGREPVELAKFLAANRSWWRVNVELCRAGWTVGEVLELVDLLRRDWADVKLVALRVLGSVIKDVDELRSFAGEEARLGVWSLVADGEPEGFYNRVAMADAYPSEIRVGRDSNIQIRIGADLSQEVGSWIGLVDYAAELPRRLGAELDLVAVGASSAGPVTHGGETISYLELARVPFAGVTTGLDEIEDLGAKVDRVVALGGVVEEVGSDALFVRGSRTPFRSEENVAAMEALFAPHLGEFRRALGSRPPRFEGPLFEELCALPVELKASVDRPVVQGEGAYAPMWNLPPT